ncbi:glycosyltransferase family 32 protein [Vibrio viridaestus]|uniref:Glycosyl transferase n=1 Tax=Vibrio viridaestus TaxID=2487322 RepID=A0A3N9TBZ9_9VIBR|nr:glycosyltransferase [Vibrio viridaestus]RQW61728.1 glycosyl transferase [Vibrio viridaestus]
MNKLPIVVANRSIRLIGNIIKLLSYPFHYVFPKKRFTIPEESNAKVTWEATGNVPRVIWQTNYSNKSTLPIYFNYLFNRLLSLDFEYRYVSTEEREVFMKEQASENVYEAYMKLNDGAAQADLWRLTVLYTHGGIYLDIDACIVWPLRKLIQDVDNALYVKIKNDTEYSNFFLATVPGNEDFLKVINIIVNNINNYKDLEKKGVYSTTGPDTLNQVLNTQDNVKFTPRKYLCIQGAFTNEHFQYLDKPRGKWTHMKDEDLIK